MMVTKFDHSTTAKIMCTGIRLLSVLPGSPCSQPS